MRAPVSWLAELVELPAGLTAPAAGRRAGPGRARGRAGRPRRPTRISGRCVVGRVLEHRGADRVQEADPVLPGRRRARTEPRGIVCGARNFAERRPGRGRAARRGAAGAVPDRRPQDLRPHLRRHDLLGPRAGPRRGPRRHPGAAAGLAEPGDGRPGRARHARRRARHRGHPGPRLLPVDARAGPGGGGGAGRAVPRPSPADGAPTPDGRRLPGRRSATRPAATGSRCGR